MAFPEGDGQVQAVWAFLVFFVKHSSLVSPINSHYLSNAAKLVNSEAFRLDSWPVLVAKIIMLSVLSLCEAKMISALSLCKAKMMKLKCFNIF